MVDAVDGGGGGEVGSGGRGGGGFGLEVGGEGVGGQYGVGARTDDDDDDEGGGGNGATVSVGFPSVLFCFTVATFGRSDGTLTGATTVTKRGGLNTSHDVDNDEEDGQKRLTPLVGSD